MIQAMQIMKQSMKCPCGYMDIKLIGVLHGLIRFFATNDKHGMFNWAASVNIYQNQTFPKLRAIKKLQSYGTQYNPISYDKS